MLSGYLLFITSFLCNFRCPAGWQDGTAGGCGGSPESGSSVFDAKQWDDGADL